MRRSEEGVADKKLLKEGLSFLFQEGMAASPFIGKRVWLSLLKSLSTAARLLKPWVSLVLAGQAWYAIPVYRRINFEFESTAPLLKPQVSLVQAGQAWHAIPVCRHIKGP